jgi:predicted NUDIX family NTP pyrophosphohydrolase
VHPTGPIWTRNEAGAWSIPKGEFLPDKTPEVVARRDFGEETGIALPMDLVALSPVTQSPAKTVHPFAGEFDLDPATIRSISFELEWPPRSGLMQTFPEIDRAAWFTLDEARTKIVAGQRPILDELERRLTAGAV